MKWVKTKEKIMSESYYWEGKKEIEIENYFVYYNNGEIKYQIHSADRTIGENSGKWVCSYESQVPNIKNEEGYIGIKNGSIIFCGGNGTFNAIGLPSIAEYNTVKEAKKVCELHNRFLYNI